MKFGRCVKFRPGLLAQFRAIRELVAPEEMADLVVLRPLRSFPMGYSFAPAVSGWLAGHFNAGTLTYIADPKGDFDVWCSPWATRARGGGDCDDLAIMSCSFLLAGGVDAHVVVGRIAQGGRLSDHAWVEGKDRFGGFMIEATSGGFSRVRPRSYMPLARLAPTRLELAA